MADLDLTQYNGTSAFPATADVGTNADDFLVPTDGKLITALSNLVNEAPVNRSLKRVKDLLLGLRGATIGDFIGAVQKTFNGLVVDGVGGVTHTASGFIRSPEYISPASGTMRAKFFSTAIAFYDSLASGTNPVSTAALANVMNALLIPKAWVRWETDGVGGITVSDGASITSVTLPGGNVVRITFATAFENVYYVSSKWIWDLNTGAEIASRPTATAAGSMEITLGVDPAANQFEGMHIFFGRQTT